MEWVKRRVFEFRKEDPCHTEVEHVVFMRHRSDGTMWYQVSRFSMADMIHRLPGGWLHGKWEYFLDSRDPAPIVSPESFDMYFEHEMHQLRGVEVELMFKNER